MTLQEARLERKKIRYGLLKEQTSVAPAFFHKRAEACTEHELDFYIAEMEKKLTLLISDSKNPVSASMQLIV